MKISQMFTEVDNVTYDAIRVLAVISIVVALGLEIAVTVWKMIHPDATVTFDLTNYGLGLGAVFLSVGGALKLKEREGVTATETTVQSKTTTTTNEPPVEK